MVEAVVHEGFAAPMVPLELRHRTERIAHMRARVDAIRDQVRRRFEQGATGAQAAGLQSQLIDEFVVSVLAETLQRQGKSAREAIEAQSALLAVGGTGRGELCPYSDVDLLFLCRPKVMSVFEPFAADVQRDLWDSGLKLGPSVRTLTDALSWSRQDSKFATSLVDARRLWGETALCEQLVKKFLHYVRGHSPQFIAASVTARDGEREEHSATTQQLEPDVKRALGGLRDLHLIRWVGYARFGAGDIDTLRLQGALSKEEARKLVHAHEFLMGLRVDLHLAAGKEQDVLSREDQLRIARQRHIEPRVGQSPVERFMQEYFQHSTVVASIARRFVANARQSPLAEQVMRFVLSHRVDDIYNVGLETVDIARRHRATACGSIEGVLQLFLTAVRCRVRVAPHLIELIKTQNWVPAAHLSPIAAQAFLSLLKTPGRLGLALRGLHETEVLDAVLPCWSHIRCLLQFNQYHHFTVDEHTLRAIEAAESFETDKGPVGQAYREIHHKELLHLALLLHDAGKGFDEDHSEVGRRLAAEAADRLGLPDHQRELVMFLVHRHLKMADLALRRDIGDRALLLKFSHEVGSPDALRMLYVLTAADISAVGPGTWNQWKAELTTTLYDRTMLWLSGKSHLFDEATRLRTIEQQVVELMCPPEAGDSGRTGAQQDGFWAESRELRKRLAQCPAHYLLETPPDRIAADFRIIQTRPRDDIHVESQYDSETGTAEYRVILHEEIASGCFHKLSGALSAKRLEILSAAICTTQDGVIIDSCRVRDADHADEIPDFRIAEVSQAIRRVLRGETDVETLLKSRGRFAVKSTSGPVSDLPLRVVVDNESSDRYTVVDVFAHDRPGLLYTITRALYVLELSVALAKIATHFDQVLDVFFVTDIAGHKIQDGARLKQIREYLLAQLIEFESSARSESAG